MKNPKLLIIRIALGVSFAAFVFSVITLIRCVTLGTPAFIYIVQTVGTGVVVVICAFMARILKYSDDEDDLYEVPKEDADTPRSELFAEKDEFFNYVDSDDVPADESADPLDDKGYDLSVFDK